MLRMTPAAGFVQTSQRGAEAAERTRVQWAREPGSIFAKVRKPAVKAEGVVSLQQGDSACMDDVHSSMLESWLPIFRKFSTEQEPSYEEFKARYGRYIPYLPHEVAPVTPEMLLNNLRLTKKGKSAGRVVCAGIDNPCGSVSPASSLCGSGEGHAKTST